MDIGSLESNARELITHITLHTRDPGPEVEAWRYEIERVLQHGIRISGDASNVGRFLVEYALFAQTPDATTSAWRLSSSFLSLAADLLEREMSEMADEDNEPSPA